VLIGVPLVLAGLWAPRPEGRAAGVAVSPDVDQVTVQGDAAAVRMRFISHGYRDATVLVRPGTLAIDRPTARTGPQPALIVDWDAHTADLLAFTAPDRVKSGRRVVLPGFAPLGLVPTSRRPRGLTGPAVSRRPGDGFELRDVHPLGPGDTTRRIDWKVTARQADAEDTLWVRGTYATGEAVVVLVLDSRDEVGPNLSTWSGWLPLRPDEATSLDLARNAAASIARRLIEDGDRVGLADLATGRRLMMPATGWSHLERLTYALALSAPFGPPRERIRPPRVPAGALVYLFSTLLDDAPVQQAEALAAGHRVVVVDTLPTVKPVASPELALAWRVVAAEHAARARRLGARGVPVVGWSAVARGGAAERLAVIRRTWQRGRP